MSEAISEDPLDYIVVGRLRRLMRDRRELGAEVEKLRNQIDYLTKSRQRLVALFAKPGVDYHGQSCGNPGCPCEKPGAPCHEFEGLPGERHPWCPRCGWHRKHHPEDGAA